MEGKTSRGECGFPAEAGGATPPGRQGGGGGGEGEQAAGAGSSPSGEGGGLVACRHFTVEAPAGAMGVGDPVAAERLALLRCQPWLLASPVHLQRLSLASSCCRVVPPRPARGGGGDGGGEGEREREGGRRGEEEGEPEQAVLVDR